MPVPDPSWSWRAALHAQHLDADGVCDCAGGGSSLGWFVVTDYGATGDGTTDDTSSINDAIAAMNTAGAGVLYFPAGDYKVTAGLTTITASGTCLGDGPGVYSEDGAAPAGLSSVISFTSTTAVLFTVTAMSFWFRGLSMVCTGTATNGAAIESSSTDFRQRVNYDSVFISDFWIGVDCQVNGGFTMSNCNISSPLKYGVKVRNTEHPDAGGFTIIGTSIVGQAQAADAGIRIESSGGNKIIATNINNVGDYGIQLSATASVILLIEGCSIEAYLIDGVHLSGGGNYQNAAIIGNEFGQYGNATGHAIYTTGFDRIAIDNNVFVANTGSPTAISLNSGTKATVGPNVNVGFGTLLATSSFTSLIDSTGAVGNSVLITGTPSAGQVPTASSGTAATWATPASGLTVEDEGTPLATAAGTLDFVGAGVTATGAGAEKTITIPGTPSGAAGGDLSGTYPNPSVVDDSHSHTSATAPGGGLGPLLLASDHAVPITFDDILQASDGSDLLYASEP